MNGVCYLALTRGPQSKGGIACHTVNDVRVPRWLFEFTHLYSPECVEGSFSEVRDL
jgi:hypothetical protein